MTNSFTNRIEALKERLENQKAIYVPEYIDSLSQSLQELGAELAALDDLGVMLEAQELEISPAAMRSMAQSLTRPVWR